MIEAYTPPSCAAGTLTVLQGFIHSGPMEGKNALACRPGIRRRYQAKGPVHWLMNMSEIIFLLFLTSWMPGEPSMPEHGANAMNGRSQPRSGSVVSKRDSRFWAVGILDHIRPGMDGLFRLPWHARLEMYAVVG